MKMQYLESLQEVVTTEIRIWDPSQPPSVQSVQNVQNFQNVQNVEDINV